LVTYVAALVAAWICALYFTGKVGGVLVALIADVVATLVVFIFSTIFSNASLYDPYWSAAPLVIAWYWLQTGWVSGGSVVAMAAIIFWGIRLTSNWLRGWHGLSHEDWRYVMLRAKNPKWYWFTNLMGIHLFPTLMVFMGMLPVYFIFYEGGTANIIVGIGYLLATIAVFIELVADEQLRAFKKQAANGEFITTGLWRYSRHPNYFGEILFWFSLWVMLMGIAPAFWWTGIGFVAMLLMFVFASIPMMEKKNRKSKPGYDTYISKVSMLIPWISKN